MSADIEFFIECEEKGFEGLYAVSREGKVMSLKNGKILKQSVGTHGYLCVNFYNKIKVANRTVHRLIAKAWISNPENKLEVDHIDRNKLNNSIENLRWVSHQENNLNKDCVEFAKHYRISNSKTYPHPSKWVVQWCENDKYKRKSFLTNKEAIAFAKENLEGQDFLQPLTHKPKVLQ